MGTKGAKNVAENENNKKEGGMGGTVEVKRVDFTNLVLRSRSGWGGHDRHETKSEWRGYMDVVRNEEKA